MRLPRYCTEQLDHCPERSASSMSADERIPVFYAVLRARVASFWERLRASKNSILRALGDAKCVIPCLNGGRCKGVNKCRCPAGLGGNHCEVRRGGPCARACRHGACVGGACVCEPGWRGRACHRGLGSSEESGEFKRPR